MSSRDVRIVCPRLNALIISNILNRKSRGVSSCKFQHLTSEDSSNPPPLCDNRKEVNGMKGSSNNWKIGLCVLFFPRFHTFCSAVNGQLFHIWRMICGIDSTGRLTAYTHTHTNCSVELEMLCLPSEYWFRNLELRIHKRNFDWNFKIIFIQIIYCKVKKSATFLRW